MASKLTHQPIDRWISRLAADCLFRTSLDAKAPAFLFDGLKVQLVYGVQEFWSKIQEQVEAQGSEIRTPKGTTVGDLIHEVECCQDSLRDIRELPRTGGV